MHETKNVKEKKRKKNSLSKNATPEAGSRNLHDTDSQIVNSAKTTPITSLSNSIMDLSGVAGVDAIRMLLFVSGGSNEPNEEHSKNIQIEKADIDHVPLLSYSLKDNSDDEEDNIEDMRNREHFDEDEKVNPLIEQSNLSAYTDFSARSLRIPDTDGKFILLFIGIHFSLQ